MQFHKRLSIVLGIAGLTAGLGGIPMAHAQNADVVYKATLTPLNSTVAGFDASGEATFTISGDQLTIRIAVKGVPPDTEHWQHFHGFATGDRTSTCPAASDDANGDGIIDLIETEAKAGTTMVPFNADPVRMDIPADTYPVAAADGTYAYEKTVSLKALEAAFAKQFPGQQLDLDRRVVFIHGVPASTKLPDSVASLGPIPAQVTIPIACGEITKLEQGTPVARPQATPQATPQA
ncbi:MAG TPA: hypothetical protein VFX03_16310 [Thermomicrobiales bacterium]|nr:hypothetical protein [Thermomicrobiales bacterium]